MVSRGVGTPRPDGEERNPDPDGAGELPGSFETTPIYDQVGRAKGRGQQKCRHGHAVGPGPVTINLVECRERHRSKGVHDRRGSSDHADKSFPALERSERKTSDDGCDQDGHDGYSLAVCRGQRGRHLSLFAEGVGEPRRSGDIYNTCARR